MIHLRLCLFLVTFFPSIALGAKPNFVLIFTDDQGYGDLGCFGSVSVSGVGKDWEDRHAYESDNQAVQLFDLEKDLAQKTTSPPNTRNASPNSRRSQKRSASKATPLRASPSDHS